MGIGNHCRKVSSPGNVPLEALGPTADAPRAGRCPRQALVPLITVINELIAVGERCHGRAAVPL